MPSGRDCMKATTDLSESRLTGGEGEGRRRNEGHRKQEQGDHKPAQHQ
jgi:hypothetical protein